MFNFLKNIFATSEGWGGGRTASFNTTETPMFAKITEFNGRFFITDRTGKNLVATDYGRARDAKRGALRRGFAVA